MSIRAQEGPQREFIRTRADIAVYGGAAGSGKSFALLLDPLRWVREYPGFGGVLFRRTYPQITAEGGLWDESAELYARLGATPVVGRLEWRFAPHGNTIAFRSLQHEAN